MPKCVSKKSFGGRISDLWDALWSDRHLPKRFRNFLKAHGDESITSIEMFRLPVDHIAEAVAQLITAGDFEGIKKRAGVDRVFHVGMLINNKYTLRSQFLYLFNITGLMYFFCYIKTIGLIPDIILKNT